VAAEVLDAWAKGGNLNEGSSIFRYSFVPIHDFLTNLDFVEFASAALTLEKAVEYSNCQVHDWPPVHQWQPGGQYQQVTNGECGSEGLLPISDLATCLAAAQALGLVDNNYNNNKDNNNKMDSAVRRTTTRGHPAGCYSTQAAGTPLVWLETQSLADQGSASNASETRPDAHSRHSICMSGEFGCQCVRQCANGGVLDLASCTCKCRGDLWHGWTGPECRETYGSCQPGAGAFNPDLARACPVRNRCESWQNWRGGAECRATDICCTSNVEAKCCPFGSTCACTWEKCTCA
ncbi:unnamed protein product, partial [Polarella glacialis]